MNLFITSHQRRRSPCIKVSHSIFLVNYIFMLFNMDDWLQDHMVKTHCSGHRVDAGSGTDTAHAAAGTSPCLPRCCQPQTLKRPLKKTSPEPSRFRGCMHAGKESVSERFAFEHICGPGLCSRPAGFTPPSEQSRPARLKQGISQAKGSGLPPSGQGQGEVCQGRASSSPPTPPLANPLPCSGTQAFPYCSILSAFAHRSTSAGLPHG